jgi:hypothetical protein
MIDANSHSGSMMLSNDAYGPSNPSKVVMDFMKGFHILI